MGNTPLIFVRYFWGGRLTSHNFLVLGDDLVVLTVSRKIYMVTIVSTEWFATSISISPTTNNPPKSNITTEHKRHPQKKKKLVLQSPSIFGKLFVWDKFNTSCGRFPKTLLKLIGWTWRLQKQLWRYLLLVRNGWNGKNPSKKKTGR